MTQAKTKPYEKDRAYGWLIVLASFSIQFIAIGIDFTFGIFYVDISNEFFQVGKAGTSWIPSILNAVAHAVGPVTSILTNKYGLRTVSLLGSLLAATGFALSFFAQSASIMYLTIGVIGGLGTGFLYLPAMVAIPQFFDKKLAFAMGLAVSGSGFGTLFFEWAFGLLLLNYPWRVALLITAGIFLTTIPFGLIYRDPKSVSSPTSPSSEEDNLVKSSEKEEEEKVEKQPKIFEVSLLKNVLFILFSSADLLASFAWNIPLNFLPDIEEDLTKSGSFSLLGYMAISSVGSRVVFGYFSDKPFINRYWVYTASLAVGGITTAVAPQIQSLGLLRANSALYGACTGIYLGLKSVNLVDLFGSEVLTDAFGLLLLVQAFGMCFGAPLAGYLYDQFGDYIFGFYFAGGMFFLSSLLLALIPLLQTMYDLKSHKSEKENKLKDSPSGSGYSTFTESESPLNTST